MVLLERESLRFVNFISSEGKKSFNLRSILDKNNTGKEKDSQQGGAAAASIILGIKS
jgi:hypothetical protein